MALTGTFQADFSQFSTAVDKAVVQLRGFESGAGKVETSLNRMAESFSGTKIIQQASLMAEVFDRAGNGAGLTTAELARMGNTAAEAVEKMRALGHEVPANIKALATHARSATGEFTSMKSVVTDLAAGLVAAFSVQKVLQFVGSVTASARELRNLNLETGIGIEKLQLYGAVTDDFGITTDQLGKAIFNMSTRIAGNDKSMAGSLHLLGLTFEQFKGKRPDEIFETLLRAIGAMPEGFNKADVAANLFDARTGRAILRVASNFDAMVAAARTSNKVMSTDTVQAAAAAADNYDRLATNAKNVGAALLGPVFEGLNKFVTTSEKMGFWTTFWARLQDGATGASKHFDELTAKVKALDAAQRDIELFAPVKGKAETAVTDEDRMTAIRIDQVKALTAAQEKYLEQLFDMNKLTNENAAAFGVSAEQMENFRKKEEQIIETQTLMSAQIKDMDALRLEAEKRYGAALDISNAKDMKRLELRTAYIASLMAERAAAVAVNTERNLGPSQSDPALAAALRRDAGLADIARKQENAPFLDLTPLIQKVWQDFDALILGTAAKGGVGGTTTVNMNVSGVWDPATIRQITAAISEQLMSSSGRKWGSA